MSKAKLKKELQALSKVILEERRSLMADKIRRYYESL